ncbi:MAG TPA: hypothetical protein VFT66_15440 [Roseiflexaceae bacterium]|nr:hypothetical protein [Roseiflexaceae bacterium]
MMRERIVWIVALIVVAAAGFYSGQYIGVRNGQQNVAQASQQFFSQRGGNGGGGFGGGQGQQGQGGGFAGRGVSGTVASVDGDTITVTTRNGQTEKVQLATNGTVTKQTSGQASDITKGAQIVAIGQANGDTFQATAIQIGGGFGGGRGGNGGNGGNGGGRGGNGGGAPNATSTTAP